MDGAAVPSPYAPRTPSRGATPSSPYRPLTHSDFSLDISSRPLTPGLSMPAREAPAGARSPAALGGLTAEGVGGRGVARAGAARPSPAHEGAAVAEFPPAPRQRSMPISQGGDLPREAGVMIAPPDVALEPASGDNVYLQKLPPVMRRSVSSTGVRPHTKKVFDGERERDGRALSPPRA